MLSAIPASDNTRVFISKINGNDYLTMEIINSNYLFMAELYYLREAVKKIIEILNSSDLENKSSSQQSCEASKT